MKKYRLSGASKECHGGSIYCSAWSTDLYECIGTPIPASTSDGNNCESGLKNGHGSSAPNEKEKVVLVRCMATCGGNHVTIYEVGPPCYTISPNSNVTSDPKTEGDTTSQDDSLTQSLSSSSSGLRVRQTYRDADEEEVFYTCAFGGRSAVSDFTYQSNGSSIDSTTSAQSTHDNKDDDKNNHSYENIEDEGNLSADDPMRNRRSRKRKCKRPHTKTSTPKKGSVESSCKTEITNDKSIATINIGNNTSLFSNDHKNVKNLLNLSNYNGPQLCCVAGKKAIIKIIDTTQRRLLLTLVGHGDEIYDLKFSPIDPWLLISASKDESLRLWNVQTATCVIIFAGHEGHSDAVLCTAWHPLGRSIVSSGMDTTVKIWSLKEKDVQCAIEDSYLVKPKSRKHGQSQYHIDHVTNGDTCGGGVRQYFGTLCQQLPIFSSNKMHTDYVDCVQYVGDLILSKSVTNSICLWKPEFARSLAVTTIDSPPTKTNHHHHHHHHHYKNAASQVLPLRDFDLTNCDIWFIRFQANEDCTLLAAGNCNGEIRVWEIGGSSYHPGRKPFCTLTHLLCTSTVRMVSFSPLPPQNIDEGDCCNKSKIPGEDYQCLVATCDDGTVWKWDEQ